MPNDYLVEDGELYISDREGPFNTVITDGTKYERARWQNPAVYVPDPEFPTDEGRAGISSEFQTGQCLKRFLGATVSLNDRANFRLYGKIGMRAFGGTPATPVVVVSSVAFWHSDALRHKITSLKLLFFEAGR